MGVGNPFWDIHAQIWTRLEADSDIIDATHASNRIKHTANPRSILVLGPEPPAGVPELVVVDAGYKVGDRRASNATFVEKQWEIWLRGCDRDLNVYLTLSFAIFRAMVGWDDPGGFKDLSWETYGAGCFDVDLKASQESILQRPPFAENTNGWAAKWVGTTSLSFAHATLVATGTS